MNEKAKAFTLIELLVTLGIIGVLAAIAVPNLLEAQTRSKVSKERANLRSIGTALESYRVDNLAYPFAALPINVLNGGKTLTPRIRRLIPLTTPVSYIIGIPEDTFNPSNSIEDKVVNYLDRESYFASNFYQNNPPSTAGANINYFKKDPKYEWILMSFGPSRGRPNILDGLDNNDLYDPTNGTTSVGLITRLGP